MGFAMLEFFEEFPEMSRGNLRDFKKAVDSCNKGIKKGGLKRADSANLVLGMAHFNLQQYKSARSAFNKASKDKRSKKYATQWIKHMNNTIKRQKSLEEDV